MKYLLKTIVLIICGFQISLASYGQDTIPINSATGLVSVNKVVEAKGKTVQDLKKAANFFISSYSDPNALSVSMNDKKAKKQNALPRFTAIKSLEQDSTVVFECQMIINPEKKIQWDNTKTVNYIGFKINFYFKAEKFKYDITNISHKAISMYNVVNGGKFENEEPEHKAVAGSQKRWKEIKILTIDAAYLIAKEIEQYFSSVKKSQTDF